MQHFTSLAEAGDIEQLVLQARSFKADPHSHHPGRNKTLVLLFFNPSLRTRLSTQVAAQQLGMSVISLNADEGWKWEFDDHIVMNSDKAEHIREAAAVISQYADIIGLRTFPGLTDRDKDYADAILNRFREFASVPVISLESAIRHPLQSLADLVTIREKSTRERPRVVLSWAPHPKALPQAVPNSFVEWMRAAGTDLLITHPPGYDLAAEFAGDTPVEHDQRRALEGADFVYVKNWSAYKSYGRILSQNPGWTMTAEKMRLTNNGYFMHCLPVRRNVVVTDEVLDGPASLVIEQANNRTWAAQAVLARLLQNGLK